MKKRKVFFSSTDTVICMDTELGPVLHSKPYPLTTRRASSVRVTDEYKARCVRAAKINAERCASSDASESVMLLLYKVRRDRPDLWNATGSDSSKEDTISDILKECIKRVEEMQVSTLRC